MDTYFSNLYDNAKALNNHLQILTPPMAQSAHAELKDFGTCNDDPVIGGGGGYDYMHNTYEVKNDGWSWHNYWRSGVESWQDLWCSNWDIVSDHVFQYFPSWLQTKIISDSRPAFITEADLLSFCGSPQNPTLLNKDTNSTGAQESIWKFIQQERGAGYVGVWLLTNAYQDPPLPNSGLDIQTCVTTDPQYSNYEQAWHEAYRDVPYLGAYERAWFGAWWGRNEFTP